MIEEALLWCVFGAAFGVGANISSVVTGAVVEKVKWTWLRWRNRGRVKEYKTSDEVEAAFGEGSSVVKLDTEFHGRPGA